MTSTNPANDTKVNWMKKIKEIESIAIEPYEKMVENEQLFYYEPCKPKRANTWIIEGIDREGYTKHIGYFQSKAEARSAVKKILVTYPHLSKLGIVIKTRWFFQDVLKCLVCKAAK